MSPQQLRAARRRFGLSQAQLAQRLHCRQPLVAQWETSKEPLPLAVQTRCAHVFAALMHSPWIVDQKIPCPTCAGAGMIQAIYNHRGELVPATPWEGPRSA